MNEGFGMTTPTFAPTAGTSISLQSLIPTGAGVGGYGDIVVQTMDEEGNWAGEYAWWTEENLGSPNGWYDTSMTITEGTIDYKEGMFVQAPAQTKFTYSGSVTKGTIETDLPMGFSMTGNATPIAVNIQSIIPAGDGVGGYGDVVIQTMNSAGEWAGEYAWWTEENLGSPDGWYDADLNPASISIQPGEGVFVQTSAENVKFTYPGAL